MPEIGFFPYKEDPLIRKMRVQAWFKAVSIKSGLSARELEEKFREDSGKKVKCSCIWNKYRRGEVVPRLGYREDGRPNLAERVEAEFPKTSTWLQSPVWRLADKTPMEMSEIRAVYFGLPAPIRPLFVLPRARPSDRFWRSSVPAKAAFHTLFRMRDMEAFSAMLAMVKEAEIIQSRKVYEHAVCAALELMRMLEERPSGNLVGSDLYRYLKESWGDLIFPSQRSCA